jgi:hypothetical protein
MDYFHVITNAQTREVTQVPFTAEEIAAAEAKAAELAKTEYQRQRAAEYPSYADQFDLLYHGGYDAWKAAIDTVKNKYPKPESA